MKKYWWISIPVIAIIIGVVIYFFPQVDLTMNGEDTVVLNYQEEYVEQGAKATLFGFDISNKVTIEQTVDVNTLADYPVVYTVKFGNVTKTLTRTVSVKDLSAPEIEASFDKVIYIEQEGVFAYPQLTATDNYDGDVTASIVEEKLDTNAIGVHFVEFSVEDSSGNVGVFVQPVAIYDSLEGKTELPLELTTGVYQMKVVEDQLVINGYAQGVETLDSLVLKNETDSYSLDTAMVSTMSAGYFTSTCNFDEVKNGTYQLYYNETKLEELGAIVNCYRLGRYHIGNKLVAFSYVDGITLTVEDFEYQYDIAIDVGHGGIDVGASGISVYERDLNLEVSLYEKKRYEEHGLKVWLIREGKDYPELLGDEEWETLQNVSYTLGWYGAVSRYTYSNHHNSDTIGATSGPEIIVLPNLTKEELAVEYRLSEEYQSVYKLITTPWLLFTRSYNTGSRFDRLDGQVFDERIWYANMRYPYECFGVVVTTYEGAYINNIFDDYWYVRKDNWKAVSEAKIKAYVEALGKEYIAPK